MGVSAENRTGIGISDSQGSGVEFPQQRCAFARGGSLGRGQAPAAQGSSTDPVAQSETASEIRELPFIRFLNSTFSSANILIHRFQLTEKDADHHKPRVPRRNPSGLSDSSKSSYDLFTSLFDSVHHQSRCRVYF